MIMNKVIRVVGAARHSMWVENHQTKNIPSRMGRKKILHPFSSTYILPLKGLIIRNYNMAKGL
jgi:hypothetical protein